MHPFLNRVLPYLSLGVATSALVFQTTVLVRPFIRLFPSLPLSAALLAMLVSSPLISVLGYTVSLASRAGRFLPYV
jgi:hypothetical protein